MTPTRTQGGCFLSDLCCFKCCLNGRHHSLHTEHFCNRGGRAWLPQLHLRQLKGVGEWERLEKDMLHPSLPWALRRQRRYRGSNSLKSEFSSLSPKSASAVSYSPSCYLSQALQQAQVGVDCIWCEGGIELSAICDGNLPTRQQL